MGETPDRQPYIGEIVIAWEPVYTPAGKSNLVRPVPSIVQAIGPMGAALLIPGDPCRSLTCVPRSDVAREGHWSFTDPKWRSQETGYREPPPPLDPHAGARVTYYSTFIAAHTFLGVDHRPSRQLRKGERPPVVPAQVIASHADGRFDLRLIGGDYDNMIMRNVSTCEQPTPGCCTPPV